jgi:hypothetical protein
VAVAERHRWHLIGWNRDAARGSANPRRGTAVLRQRPWCGLREGECEAHSRVRLIADDRHHIARLEEFRAGAG